MNWHLEAIRNADWDSQNVPMPLLVEAENTERDARSLALELMLIKSEHPSMQAILEEVEKIAALDGHLDMIDDVLEEHAYEASQEKDGACEMLDSCEVSIGILGDQDVDQDELSHIEQTLRDAQEIIVRLEERISELTSQVKNSMELLRHGFHEHHDRIKDIAKR